MKTLILSIGLLLFYVSLSAQKVKFETISFPVKGDTIQTVRLTSESREFLAKTLKEDYRKINPILKNIESRLDLSRQEIIEHTDGENKPGQHNVEFPIVGDVTSGIRSVRNIFDFPELKMYEKEQQYYNQKEIDYKKWLSEKFKDQM